MEFPKTLLLGVSTHGMIPTIDDDRPKLMRVPKGMKITKIGVATPGVCNITFERQIELLFSKLAKQYENDRDLFSMVNTIDYVQHSPVKELASSQLKSENKGDEDFITFLRHLDRPISLNTYTSGQELVDKIYARSGEEGESSPFDFKLSMLNVKGKPDLFHFMSTGRTIAPTRSDETDISIHLSTLIDYLRSAGVKEVILLDFSCSVIDSDDPRLGRRIGLEVAKRGLGRKSTKKVRKSKRKTNRH